MNRKYLVFDICSCYGHFKKPYTTTSPLTYSVPTRTSLIGMISAIIGFEKDTCNKEFTLEKASIAIGVKNPVKKVRIAENLINTKKSMVRVLERTQIKIEFLKDPGYRIYFSHKDDKIYDSLKTNLFKHSPVYTVSMGLSENLADFKFIGEFEGETISDNNKMVEIDSIVPMQCLGQGGIEFGYYEDAEYFTETIPIEMDEYRNIECFGEVVFERNGRKIYCIPKHYIVLKELEQNIVIL